MPNLYKLKNDARPGELGGPPFILGSALRVPSTAYNSWGIYGRPKVLYELSLSTYQDEFAGTSPEWMKSVVEAANRGGIGNRPQMLRDTVGDAAAKITSKLLKTRGVVSVLDVGCGAGGSALAYLSALKSLDPSYVDRVSLTLLDLSRDNLWKTIDTIEQEAPVPPYRILPVHSRDVDMDSHVNPGSIDVALNVAGIHANSFLDRSMGAISRALSEGGYLVSGDWHHHHWLHPKYTYDFLDQIDPEKFEWGNKGPVMDEFARVFPESRATTKLPDLDPADARALEEIRRYWRDGWAPVRMERIKAGELRPTDEQIVFEGHRPAGYYADEGIRAGLAKDEEVVSDGMMRSNPQQVVQETNLNMLLVLRKS